MYEQISIQGFRGIKDLTIDKLAPINILIGNNGSGKSTVLEALWLHADPLQSALVNRVDEFRSLSLSDEALDVGVVSSPWRHLFYGFETQKPIVISGTSDNQSWSLKVRQEILVNTSLFQQANYALVREPLKKPEELLNPLNVEQRLHHLVIEYKPKNGEPQTTGIISTGQGSFALSSRTNQAEPLFPTLLLPPVVRDLQQMAFRYGIIDRANKQEEVIRLVRIIEPRLKRLSTIATISRTRGGVKLYADVGLKELVPVQLLGAGFVQLLTFAISIASLEGKGLVLIDEIENGIHYSALEPLWKGIWGLCTEMGVQIVAATHSLECVEAARAVLPPEAFLVHRLERDASTGTVRVGSLDAEMLQGAADIGAEVR
jgi:predicted ATP-dependent endonuclease of OLD family